MGSFFIVRTWLGFGRDHFYQVMSEREIMRDEGVILASGDYDTRAEAELALRQGIAAGDYALEPFLEYVRGADDECLGRTYREWRWMCDTEFCGSFAAWKRDRAFEEISRRVAERAGNRTVPTTLNRIDYSEHGQTFRVSFMFCPNAGYTRPVPLNPLGRKTLDGDIRIERIEATGKTYRPHRGGRRPNWMPSELLGKIWLAAAEAEYKEQRTTLEKFYGKKLRWR